LSPRVRAVVDTTNRWWPDVKRLRDILAHREHAKIAFGHASEGVLFQVYEPPALPLVAHPAFLWKGGTNVACFDRYSAYVLAEILVFMDALGRELANHLGWGIDGLNQAMLAGNLSPLVSALEDLRELLCRGTPAA
jgi:hypothetical protein